MSDRSLVLRACAKINLTLEVLGRRSDGYHEIRTILQTVALCDTLLLREAERPALTVRAPQGTDLGPLNENLAWRAVTAYPAAPAAALRLRKRIPAAAGLGGGSSDAAAVLRGLDRLSQTPPGTAQLERLAATLGSDPPFFVRGGTQLASGRGERLQPLPDPPPAWLVLVTPPIASGRKTARLFGLLSPTDFAEGAAAARLVRRLASCGPLTPELLYNSFDRVAEIAFPELERFRRPLIEACGHALLCGAGPSLFAIASGAGAAGTAVARLRAQRLPALAVRTVTAEASTRVRVLPANG